MNIANTVSTVLAHQGGWDEILLVAAPLTVFAVLLYVANRRAGTPADTAKTGETVEIETVETAEGAKPTKKTRK